MHMPENLPDYFLIDTQPKARITPTVVTEACRQLKRNRTQYLRDIPSEQIITMIARLSENWRDAHFPFRKLALEASPEKTPVLLMEWIASFPELLRTISTI